MLTIIHGDDIENSRKYFADLRDESSLSFDATDIDINSLSQTLHGSGLFGTDKKVFIDNLFSRKASKNYDNIIEILKHSETETYIYSDKALSSTVLKSFPKHTARLFKIPASIWSFLDGIRPRNDSNVLSFHNTLSTNKPEIIFTMIVRQFRLMLGITLGQKIEEVGRLAPWQKTKLQRQAGLFGIEKLKEAYKELYIIEKEQKTGRSSLTLVQSIDIFLLEI